MNEELTKAEKKEWEAWMATRERIRAGNKPLRGETELKKNKRIKHLLKPENFEEFIDFYFKGKDFNPAPLAWFHWEAITNIFIKKKRKHLWEFHREAAKTVFAVLFITLHKLLDDDLDGVMVASKTFEKAREKIGDIEAQLRDNQRIRNDFGDISITGSWLQGQFQLNGIGFWAFGIGQDPAGTKKMFKRPNVGIVDDVDNALLADNPDWVKKRVKWIRGEFMGCLAKDNRLFIYVNNRVHPKGVTAHLAGDIAKGDEKDKSFAHIIAYLTENPKTHEAIEFEGYLEADILKDLISKGAVPAWKEYYSLEDCVAKIIDYGRTDALRQMYHKHIVEGNTFTEETLPWVQPLPLHLYDALCSYFDPAFGESGKGSYKFGALLGLKGHYLDILWAWGRQKGNFYAAQRQLAEDIENMRFEISRNENAVLKVKVNCQHWVEANELQKTELKKTFKIENLNYDTPWYPRFDMEKKGDKEGRIEALESLTNQLLLRFNVYKKNDKDMLLLREQFKSFPDGDYDGPDAVQGGKNKIYKIKSSSSSNSRSGNFKKDKRKVG